MSKLTKGEKLLVHVGATYTGGSTIGVTSKASLATIVLTQPVCTRESEKVALSRRIDNHWRLIGFGTVLGGIVVDIN